MCVACWIVEGSGAEGGQGQLDSGKDRVWATFGNLDWLGSVPARLLSNNQGSTVPCRSLAGYIKQDMAVSQGLCSRASPVSVYVPDPGPSVVCVPVLHL